MAVAHARIVYLATELLNSVEDGICLPENAEVTDLHYQVEIGLRELLGYAEGPQNTVSEQMDCTLCACRDLHNHLVVLGAAGLCKLDMLEDAEAAFNEWKDEEIPAEPDGRVALWKGYYVTLKDRAFKWFPTKEEAFAECSEGNMAAGPMESLTYNNFFLDFVSLREAYYLNSPGGDW